MRDIHGEDVQQGAVFYLTFADKPERSNNILSVNGAEIVFDAENYSLESETLVLTDEKNSTDWRGRKTLYRVAFIPKEIKGEYTFDIKII